MAINPRYVFFSLAPDDGREPAGAHFRTRIVERDIWALSNGFAGLAGPYDFHPFDTDRSRAAFAVPSITTCSMIAVNVAAVPEALLEAIRSCVNRQRPFGADDWVRTQARYHGVENSLAANGRPRKTP